MAQPRVVEFDHHARTFQHNRHAEWQALRQCPVAYNPRYGGFWVVSDHDAVSRVSRDAATFTTEFGERDGVTLRGIAGVPRPRGIPPAGIAEADPAIHQALRRVLNPWLLPPAVRAMEPFVERLTTWAIDQKIASGGMDLVLDLANPVPAIATMKLIGLPCDGWEHYAEVFHTAVALRPGMPEYDRAMGRVPDMVAELLAEADARRHRPRDDLLTALVDLRLDDGRALTDREVSAILWNLVGGGLDTTTSLTALSLHHLDRHPELRVQLLQHPELMPSATEEFLRFYSVNETLTRTASVDVELAGQQVHQGDVVLISWMSANRDETEFDRPDEVVLDRTPNRHLAFGLGPHRCIGMHLARSMFQIMLGAVLRRLPDYRVDREATRFYEGNPTLAGVVSMPATFTAGRVVGPNERPF
jgi:cytochrome P450